MSNALTDIAIPRPSPDDGTAFRLSDYFSDLLKIAPPSALRYDL